MRLSSVLSLFLFYSTVVFAQLETTYWYFGDSAGLSFQSGTAQADLSSRFTSSNGAATQSTPDGDLLFYFGMNMIWNRNHLPMPNGTGLINANAEMGTVIIPRPSKPNQFYVFSVDAGSVFGFGDVGLFYHLIDMTLDSGLGDVVDTVKNVVLFDSTAERIAAAPHANGVDYWVAVHQCGSNRMQLVLVTENGPQLPPVTSSLGLVTTTSQECNAGSMRFNHANNKFVNQGGSWSELYDFDPSTGELSNMIELSGTGAIGVEFSADDSKLYLAGPIQYDLSNYNQAAILSSELDLTEFPIIMHGMQLGLDGRLYGTAYNLTIPAAPYMAVINNPNRLGAACNYQDSAVYLEGRGGEVAVPVFMSSYFLTDFITEGICAGDTTFFDINFHFIDSVLWNFGDPGSGAANTSTLVDAWHIYEDPGTYTVTLIAQNGVKTDTVTRTITIKAPPEIDLGPDREFCASSGSSATLSLGGKQGDYLWSDGSTDSTLTVNQSGVYALTFTDECGTGEDSVEVFASEPLSVSLPTDTSLCADSFEIIPVVSNSHRLTKYTWSSGDSTLNFTTTRDTTGEHTKLLTFTAGNTCGKDSASIAVTFLAQPDGFLPNDSIYCLDDPFFLLNKQSAGISYLWSNGNTGPQLRVAESGTYWLQSASVCDTLIDSFNITFNGEPKVNIGNDTFICPEVEVRFFNRIPSNQLPGQQSYLWSTGSTGSVLIIVFDSSQILTVSATYDQCTVRDSIRVIVQNDCPERCVPNIANFITPNGDGINDQLKINMTCRATDLNFSIYNRWGQLLYQSQSQTPSWDGSVNGELASDGTYFYVLTYMDEAGEERRFQGSFTVVR